MLEVMRKNNFKILTAIFFTLCSLLVINELYSYTVIGLIHQERVDSINSCKENDCEILLLKEIPSRYAFYHMHINSPQDSNCFAFGSFVNYYGLDENIEIDYYK